MTIHRFLIGLGVDVEVDLDVDEAQMGRHDYREDALKLVKDRVMFKPSSVIEGEIKSVRWCVVGTADEGEVDDPT